MSIMLFSSKKQTDLLLVLDVPGRHPGAFHWAVSLQVNQLLDPTTPPSGLEQVMDSIVRTPFAEPGGWRGS